MTHFETTLIIKLNSALKKDGGDFMVTEQWSNELFAGTERYSIGDYIEIEVAGPIALQPAINFHGKPISYANLPVLVTFSACLEPFEAQLQLRLGMRGHEGLVVAEPGETYILTSTKVSHKEWEWFEIRVKPRQKI